MSDIPLRCKLFSNIKPTILIHVLSCYHIHIRNVFVYIKLFKLSNTVNGSKRFV